VLSYDAVADGVPMDHIISRVLATVPLPQVTARPQHEPAAPVPYTSASSST
jgi:MoxR-like ATPase